MRYIVLPVAQAPFELNERAIVTRARTGVLPESVPFFRSSTSSSYPVGNPTPTTGTFIAYLYKTIAWRARARARARKKEKERGRWRKIEGVREERKGGRERFVRDKQGEMRRQKWKRVKGRRGAYYVLQFDSLKTNDEISRE